jgi:predicted nucleic acid-binding protein
VTPCVVDASVALKWYFREPNAEAATQVLVEGNEGLRELIAPDWIVAELANVLWKKVQRRECGADQARTILELFDVDAPELLAAAPLVPRALELALRLEESVYDCLYLAAAIESEASLVTADRRLARAARGVLAEVELLA